MEKYKWSFNSLYNVKPVKILVKECKNLYKLVKVTDGFYRTNICKEECFDSKNDCIDYVIKLLGNKRIDFVKEIDDINNNISNLLSLKEEEK